MDLKKIKYQNTDELTESILFYIPSTFCLLQMLQLPPTAQTIPHRFECEGEWLFVAVCQPCDDLVTSRRVSAGIGSSPQRPWGRYYRLRMEGGVLFIRLELEDHHRFCSPNVNH